MLDRQRTTANGFKRGNSPLSIWLVCPVTGAPTKAEQHRLDQALQCLLTPLQSVSLCTRLLVAYSCKDCNIAPGQVSTGHCEQVMANPAAALLTMTLSSLAVLSNRYVKHSVLAVVYTTSAPNRARRPCFSESPLTTDTVSPIQRSTFPILQCCSMLFLHIDDTV